MQQAVARPEDRYGRRPGRPGRTVVAAVAVVAAGFLGWVVWAALGAAAPEAAAEVTAFEVRSPQRIDVRVTAAPGAEGGFVCRVRALDETRGVAGVAEVALNADRRETSERWVTVRTRDKAVTATVAGCTARPGEQD